MQLCFAGQTFVGSKRPGEISSGEDAPTFYINNTGARRYQLLFLLQEMESEEEQGGEGYLHFISLQLLRSYRMRMEETEAEFGFLNKGNFRGSKDWS